MAPTTVHDLPNEILAQVFAHLDAPAPSESRLHDQPSPSMLSSEARTLKDTSLVCKRWRGAVLPLLFRNVIWAFNRLQLIELAEYKDADVAEHIDVLAFLRRNEITSYVQSLSLIIGDRIDGPSILTAGSVQLTETGYEKEVTFNDDVNWLWLTLFDHLNPMRIILIATPRTLATLISRMIFLGDAWSFTTAPHILTLSLQDRKAAPISTPTTSVEGSAVSAVSAAATAASTPGVKRVPCDLFTIRPWHSILVNEGSATRVYKTYEFFLKRPPSIIGAVLGFEEFPNDERLLPPTIRVGIFPLSSHFNSMIQNLPRLDRLFVQLVPRNDILQDPEEMRNIDVSDLWMERNTSYSMLMRELFDPAADSAWLDLKVFESGDAADKEAWRMAVNYVEYSGVKGWKVERDGVFVRCDDNGDPLTLSNK
jgi:F-box-like